MTSNFNVQCSSFIPLVSLFLTIIPEHIDVFVLSLHEFQNSVWNILYNYRLTGHLTKLSVKLGVTHNNADVFVFSNEKLQRHKTKDPYWPLPCSYPCTSITTSNTH